MAGCGGSGSRAGQGFGKLKQKLQHKTLPCCCNNYHGLQYLLRIKLLVGERPGQDWGGKVIPQLLRVSPHTQSSFILMPFEMPDQ